MVARTGNSFPVIPASNMHMEALGGSGNRLYAATSQGVFQYAAGDSRWNLVGDANGVLDVSAFARSGDTGEGLLFASWDEDLERAAAREGVKVLGRSL